MTDSPQTPPTPPQAQPAGRSAHDRVVQAYFETTSGNAAGTAVADFAAGTQGLRRGLGPWLDVAGQRVLDLGSGTGELCWLARQSGARSVVGVNLSSAEIAHAQRHVDAQFVHADVIDYLAAQPAASVDRIFALNLLEHLGKDDLVRLLEQAHRCLADQGTLVAMVPNAISSFSGMTRYWDITHQIAFAPSSVRQLMRLCGYADCGFREWGPQPHGLASTVRYLLWQGIRAATALRLIIETGSAKGGVYTADMLFRLIKQAPPG